jgi:hypothetical protein
VGTNDRQCVTKSPALLNVPLDGAHFNSKEGQCQLVTGGVSIRPSVHNASGWNYCQLKASVRVNRGATLRFNDPLRLSTTQANSNRGTLLQSTLSLATFQGTPPAVEEFLNRQIRFCPSCLPRDYSMKISLTTLGSDVLSPCPTDATVDHHITARTASIQTLKLVVRNASCTQSNTCTSSASLLSGVEVNVNAGACFQQSVLSQQGQVSMDVPLSNPNNPSPRQLQITISKLGFANVTLLQDRFDGPIDLGNIYLVPNTYGANWQNPVLAGIVLDATNNSAYNFAMNDVAVTVDCYRGYGITSGDNSKVATTPIDSTGRFQFPDLQPGLYTVVARAANSDGLGDDQYIMNYKTSMWTDDDQLILLSPVVPEGSLRIVMSWDNKPGTPTDLDLHVKFKPTDDAKVSKSPAPAARRLDGASWVTEDKEPDPNEGTGAGYGWEEKEEDGGGYDGYGYGDDTVGGSSGGYEGYGDVVSEELGRECDVFMYSFACGGAVMETYTNDKTVPGGESILLQNMYQTVYTVFLRNYLADGATEHSGAILEMYDNTGKRETITLPSTAGVNYATGVTPDSAEDTGFAKDATYARMACLDSVGGTSTGIFGVGRYDLNPTSGLVAGECPPTNERNLCSANNVQTITGLNGTVDIYDGSGAFYNYPPNQDCLWDIAVADDALLKTKHLMLSWTRFELERWGDSCEEDYVTVWDSSCKDKADSNLLYKTCGCGVLEPGTRPSGPTCGPDMQLRMPHVITNGAKMCVQYHTNGDVNLNGIQGTVAVVNDVAPLKAKCQNHADCHTCTSDPDCGWCQSTASCAAGNSLGDFNTGANTCPNDMWSQNDCLCRGVVEWDIKALTPGGHKYTVTDGSADGHHYDNDMRCKWKLYTTPKANVQEVILLKFPAFELEPNQFCMFYDYVSVSWQDHTGTNKVKTLCNNRMGQVDTIEITGEHPLTNPVTVKFKSSRSNTFSGFKIEPSVATQTRVLRDETWSGCECDPEATWTLASGATGRGCADIDPVGTGDGRAICVVKPGSCVHSRPPQGAWPPRGKPTMWANRDRPCLFPFKYKGVWHNDCINMDNGNQGPWCSPRRQYFEHYAGRINKIKCNAGKTDYYEETQHLDYCSSWKTDVTGTYVNELSASPSENPVLSLYKEDDGFEFSYDWGQTVNNLFPRL